MILAIVFDLDLLSKKGSAVSMKKALLQTSFWVFLAMAFFGFLWFEQGQKVAVEYFSAYLMEWSLSIDNIFVFILIFSFFQDKRKILRTRFIDRNFNGNFFTNHFYHRRSGLW